MCAVCLLLAEAAAQCDKECQQYAAQALCLELVTLLPADHPDAPATHFEDNEREKAKAKMILPMMFRPLLKPRARVLYRELGCEEQPLHAQPLVRGVGPTGGLGRPAQSAS